MGKSIEEVAIIASTWWADRVVSPTFDNGGSDRGNIMAMGLAMMGVKPVSKEAREKFIEHLAKTIVDSYNEYKKNNTNPNYVWHMILSVDYGADGKLRASAQHSGVPLNNFPWKTTMWIGEDHVNVRGGYRANVEHLYATKNYWRKMIDSAKEGIEEYSKDDACPWLDGADRKDTIKKVMAEYRDDIMQYEKNLELAEE